MRTRKLRIFLVVFIAVVLLASYGLALLRTYVFKPPSGSSRIPSIPASVDTVEWSLGAKMRDPHVQEDVLWIRSRSSGCLFPAILRYVLDASDEGRVLGARPCRTAARSACR